MADSLGLDHLLELSGTEMILGFFTWLQIADDQHCAENTAPRNGPDTRHGSNPHLPRRLLRGQPGRHLPLPAPAGLAVEVAG